MQCMDMREKMDWYKFDNLIRQLFEAMGLEVHVTQSSRDGGIDAVAYNKTDIVHQAEILIQAKRYSRCVSANDVRALAGSVEEKRATAGVLVTTAWVGAETKAFAARNNRLRIIEGGELSTSSPSTSTWTSASTSDGHPGANRSLRQSTRGRRHEPASHGPGHGLSSGRRSSSRSNKCHTYAEQPRSRCGCRPASAGSWR